MSAKQPAPASPAQPSQAKPVPQSAVGRLPHEVPEGAVPVVVQFMHLRESVATDTHGVVSRFVGPLVVYMWHGWVVIPQVGGNIWMPASNAWFKQVAFVEPPAPSASAPGRK